MLQSRDMVAELQRLEEEQEVIKSLRASMSELKSCSTSMQSSQSGSHG